MPFACLVIHWVLPVAQVVLPVVEMGYPTHVSTVQCMVPYDSRSLHDTTLARLLLHAIIILLAIGVFNEICGMKRD